MEEQRKKNNLINSGLSKQEYEGKNIVAKICERIELTNTTNETEECRYLILNKKGPI